MGWVRRRLGREDEPDAGDPIDIDALLATAGRDPRQRSMVLKELQDERKRLEHQRKVIDRRFKRLTSGRAKVIGYSSSANPNIGVNMLRDEMRTASEANQLQNNDDLVAIDLRLALVDDAISTVKRLMR